jgi:ligand-binding SRPBCC domain-containing protein
MPLLEAQLVLPRPVEEVFDFFCRPAHWVELAPPDLHMTLVEEPERVELGSLVRVKVSRWGLAQHLAGEVTALEPNARFVEEQRDGPFRRWAHSHLFEAVTGGMRLTERVEYEPPGGALGLLMNAALIGRELEEMFAYRRRKLEERFGTMV